MCVLRVCHREMTEAIRAHGTNGEFVIESNHDHCRIREIFPFFLKNCKALLNFPCLSTVSHSADCNASQRRFVRFCGTGRRGHRPGARVWRDARRAAVHGRAVPQTQHAGRRGYRYKARTNKKQKNKNKKKQAKYFQRLGKATVRMSYPSSIMFSKIIQQQITNRIRVSDMCVWPCFENIFEIND